MIPGYVERREQEYIRHGTTALIASRDVRTGEILSPMIRPTRKEADFVEHIQWVVSQDPEGHYVFVMDQLNTHQSESLVCFVAAQLDIPQASLGEKEQSGILKSKKTRAAFLSDDTHRIRVVYTPKHCSWMNQIECWFSILTRDLLNPRASFHSMPALSEALAQYIDYYNQHLAKPFHWTFKGRALQM